MNDSPKSIGARTVFLLPLLLLAPSLAAAPESPLALHPENPHYFVFRGKPTVLITSGEHYGAVLNLDFDFDPYLAELQRCGFNLTRTFSGTYREVPGSFKIRDNTLAPKAGRFCSPWPETNGKFNLEGFHRAYFQPAAGVCRRGRPPGNRRGICAVLPAL